MSDVAVFEDDELVEGPPPEERFVWQLEDVEEE